MKARTRKYSSDEATCPTAFVATLVALGLLLFNSQAVWASAAMTVQKKVGSRLVSDYR